MLVGLYEVSGLQEEYGFELMSEGLVVMTVLRLNRSSQMHQFRPGWINGSWTKGRTNETGPRSSGEPIIGPTQTRPMYRKQEFGEIRFVTNASFMTLVLACLWLV